MSIYSIYKASIRDLLFDKIPTIVIVKYFKYSNIFWVKNIIEFLKYTKINEHTIKLEKDKQSFYSLIYNLLLVK